MAIALPTMTRQLHATPAASVWIVNAYQLVIVVALLPLASLGEKVSYRCVYVTGLHSLLPLFLLGVFFVLAHLASGLEGGVDRARP